MTAIILQIVVGLIGLIKFWYARQQTQEYQDARRYEQIQDLREAIDGMGTDELNRRLDRLLSQGSYTGRQYDATDIERRLAKSTGASVLPRTGSIS